MAEEKHLEKVNAVKTTEVKKTVPSEKRWWSNRPAWLPVVLLTFVFLALLWTAFSLGRHSQDRFDRDDRVRAGMMQNGSNSPRSMRGGMMDDDFNGPRGRFNNGTGTNTTSSTRVSGVVTAVDSNTLTVAGNGTTTKVTVNDNTAYTGSDKPAKVNDTIMAFGARDASNNLVASTVRLSRQ